ncbi:MAG: FAD-dependent oxidoreductase [Pseudomonadota bacterium]
MVDQARIGVFVCHCGNNIGGVVNVPQVVDYCRSLPGVVYSEGNLYTCSEDGLGKIAAAIARYGLNRVVVASCTPRTHEGLFKACCQKAGVNKYLFEFVNLREHCSWVHMKEPAAATRKAQVLVRMGVAKAGLLEPQQEVGYEVRPVCLVVGGGVAGMTAALSLARQGFKVHLVEKEPQLGGKLRFLHRLFPTGQHASEVLDSLAAQVYQSPNIVLHLGCELAGLHGYIGTFKANLRTPDWDKALDVGTIIIATGASELKADGLYQYGELPGIVTQLELERRLKESRAGLGNVAMVLCAGARDKTRQYCSRLCCMNAVKNATLIKEANPSRNVYVLYRDLMTYGTDAEELLAHSRKVGVRYVRYDPRRPPEPVGEARLTAVRVHSDGLGHEVSLPVDTLVLVTPLVANAENPELAKHLKVPLIEEQFFLEAHVKLRPVEFATDGIYICGSAKWPCDVPESVSQALAAAAKASAAMGGAERPVEAVTAFVNESLCRGCGVCVPLCPYSAIELRSGGKGVLVSHVNEVVCKGCGVCGVACPSRAITNRHFTGDQIGAMIDAALAGFTAGC